MIIGLISSIDYRAVTTGGNHTQLINTHTFLAQQVALKTSRRVMQTRLLTKFTHQAAVPSNAGADDHTRSVST